MWETQYYSSIQQELAMLAQVHLGAAAAPFFFTWKVGKGGDLTLVILWDFWHIWHYSTNCLDPPGVKRYPNILTAVGESGHVHVQLSRPLLAFVLLGLSISQWWLNWVWATAVVEQYVPALTGMVLPVDWYFLGDSAIKRTDIDMDTTDRYRS